MNFNKSINKIKSWSNELSKRIIVYLIKRRLGIKNMQCFRFANQKTDDFYWFTINNKLVKMTKKTGSYKVVESTVSLNWLLDDNCKVVRKRAVVNRST